MADVVVLLRDSFEGSSVLGVYTDQALADAAMEAWVSRENEVEQRMWSEFGEEASRADHLIIRKQDDRGRAFYADAHYNGASTRVFRLNDTDILEPYPEWWSA